MATCAISKPSRPGDEGRTQDRRRTREFVHEGLIEGLSPLVIGRASIRSHTFLGELRQLVSQRFSDRESVTGRRHPIDESHFQRFLSRYGTPGQDQIHRMPQPNQSGEADGPSIDERYPPSAAKDTQHRVLFGNPEIAPQRQFQATGHGVPGDGRDHRLG